MASQSEFYYPDELSNEEDILNATETEFTREKKQNLEKKINAGDLTTTTTSTNNKDEEEEITSFITAQRSTKTVVKTKSDVNTFKKYCKSINETREIETIPAGELNTLLSKFFINAQRQDGCQYEPNTLSSIQRSVQRYLQEARVQVNILKDDQFLLSREALAAKRKSLVAEGKGGKPNATRPLSNSEEDTLFEVGYFGDNDPLVLQRTIWWLFSLNFGFRARDESQKLRWGDVKLSVDPDTNNEILVWMAERGTKTRTGKENGHQRAFNPTIQATKSIKCPIRLFKVFRSHRPEEMINPEAPFYLAIHHQRSADSKIWFKKSPLGKNQIGRFLSKAVEAGHLSGLKKVTNHSVRKTSISRLLDANCPETFVAQLSGHKNLNSLSQYKCPSLDHQRAMSRILCRDTVETEAQSLQTSCNNTFSTSNISFQEASQRSKAEHQQLVRASCSRGSSLSLQESCHGHSSIQQSNESSTAVSFNPNEIFRGASIGNISGCSFNFYTAPPSSSTCSSVQPPVKRRRAYILDSDSD